MKTNYLIQMELDGEWVTIARRSNFDAAKAKARAEWKAMKAVRETSIIGEDDQECLRRKISEQFQIV